MEDEGMGLTSSAGVKGSGVKASSTDGNVVTNFLFYTQQKYLSKGEGKH